VIVLSYNPTGGSIPPAVALRTFNLLGVGL
jgi:hypothetical protein